MSPDFERQIQEGPREGLPALLGELARLQGLVLARLLGPVETPQPEAQDRLLTAEEAAPLTGLTARQLLTRRRLPFRRRVGHRTIRFSERALRAWLRRSS